MYTIKHLSSEYHLSRSTLLYYDSIGLLKPSERTDKNYRKYSDRDRERLGKICTLREAGIPLEEIKEVLLRDDKEQDILTKKLQELNNEIRDLRIKQKLIVRLLKSQNQTDAKMLMDVTTFKQVLYSLGFDDVQMDRFHREFEQKAPDSHRFFLEFLGLGEEEIRYIKQFM